jgi:hypothetical protein
VLTLFDNGTDGPIQTERQSRGLVLRIDESRRRVALRDEYTSPHRPLAGAMGSVQILSSGRVTVGWGVAPFTSEFAADGALLIDYALPEGMYSYRALRHPWSGGPHHRPAVAARRDPQNGTPIMYASWNGATEVTDWQVNSGSKHDQLHPLGIATRRGFETIIPLDPHLRYASVTALDRFGTRLERSHIIQL